MILGACQNCWRDWRQATSSPTERSLQIGCARPCLIGRSHLSPLHKKLKAARKIQQGDVQMAPPCRGLLPEDQRLQRHSNTLLQNLYQILRFHLNRRNNTLAQVNVNRPWHSLSLLYHSQPIISVKFLYNIPVGSFHSTCRVPIVNKVFAAGLSDAGAGTCPSLDQKSCPPNGHARTEATLVE